MIRYAAALPILLLAACAAKPQPQAMSPTAIEANQVYRALALQQFEQQMQPDDKRLTYGFAVVNCGLRSPQWLDMLQQVYARDYQMEFQRHPLTPEEAAQARAYAETRISNPSPPPYICMRLSKDDSLVDLDASVGYQSLLLATPKKKPG